jgi:hypothetical protein
MELRWQIDVLERLISSASTPADALPRLCETAEAVKSQLDDVEDKSRRKSRASLRLSRGVRFGFVQAERLEREGKDKGCKRGELAQLVNGLGTKSSS